MLGERGSEKGRVTRGRGVKGGQLRPDSLTPSIMSDVWWLISDCRI